jgi:hypothetical protein
MARRWRLAARFGAVALGFAVAGLGMARGAQSIARVPFVGCPSDGQGGPVAAPLSPAKMLAIPEGVARRLAYYQAADGPGVLGPRGWSCAALSGANGSTLVVEPRPIRPTDFLGRARPLIRGAGIQASVSFGDTSGRFAVARAIARLFPPERPFVHRLLQEGIAAASDVPFGPWPQDRVSYRSARIAEYETPANAQGLGTDSFFEPAGDPISGVALLTGDTPHLSRLALRLPKDLRDLTPDILRVFEAESPK